MRTTFILLILMGLIFSSCEKIVDPEDLNLENHKPEIFIEGYVTNRLEPYKVTVRKSASYFSETNFEAVSNATVILSDDSGQSEILTYQSGSEGVYLTSSFQGIEGHEYYLSVHSDGKEYTASCIMFPALAINSLTSRFKQAATHVNEAGYFVTVNANDRPNRLDYYRIKGYKNDTLFDKGEDYIIENDYASDGNNIEVECTFNYDIGDTAKIELISISYSTYQYYLSLQQQLTAGSGNNFTLPATNVKGNINGGALGVFAAYSISEAETVIEQ